jgi:hypothetical protein
MVRIKWQNDDLTNHTTTLEDNSARSKHETWYGRQREQVSVSEWGQVRAKRRAASAGFACILPRSSGARAFWSKGDALRAIPDGVPKLGAWASDVKL